MDENKHVSPKDFVELISDEEFKKSTQYILDSLPEETLKGIAKDVYSRVKFFTNVPDTIQTCFGMLLLFMEEIPTNIGSMYADMKDAAPMAVNGLPTFFSCGMLNQEDTKKVIEYLDKIEEAMKLL